MMKWMELYHAKLKNPDHTLLIPSNLLNPEQFYYYQKWEQGYYLDIERDNSRPPRDICVPVSPEEMEKRIS